ncbi:MAG: BglG family transcription antiterminator [Erysipelotrichaceae bacterium]|nr:BglG family transcription antiterminator [Erysipelotrichaceae bacterium]
MKYDNRQYKLLMLLENQSTWITGKELAKLLNVTDRTIRSDINAINSEYESPIIESNLRMGYRIDFSNYQKLTSDETYFIPTTPLERCTYILQKLLTKKQKVNINSLANEIYISEYSLENDLKRIKDYLEEYDDIFIKRRNNYIMLEGCEKSKRKLYKDMLVRETQKNFLNFNEIAGLYQRFDLLKAKEILERLFIEYNYEINEVLFPTLLIHLGVAIDRMMDYNYIDSPKDNKNVVNSIEYEIADKFFSELSKLYHINSNKAEISFFALLLAVNKGYDYSKDLLLTKEKQKYNLIVNDVIEYIYHQFGIDFSSNKDLIAGLGLHIQALMERTKKQTPASNLYLDEIKKRFPLVFDLAVSASNYLSKILNIYINEAEIGFIALHLGMAYEQLNLNKYRAVIIFPKTQAISKVPIAKIANIFEEHLMIVQSFNYFEEEKVKALNPDLIICSTPLKHKLKIPTVQISFFINHEDESKIYEKILELKHEKLKNEYKKYIDQVILEDHFYYGNNFTKEEDALRFMVDKLLIDGYVDDCFYSSVLEREKYSPTSFAYGFAIPHALDSCLVKKTAISVMILDKPIKWGEYEVKAIFLLAVERFDNNIIKLFFEWITVLADDVSELSKLFECHNYDTFMRLLKQ